MSPKKLLQTPPNNITMPTQVIYADKIVNMGIGASVSRLTLAMEVGENEITPFASIVIPTPSLLESLEFMTNNLANNIELKEALIKSLDAFREKLLPLDDKAKS